MDATRRIDNNLQWTLCCRSITAIDGIYPLVYPPRIRGKERWTLYRSRADIQVSIDELLLKVLSEFHNAVKVFAA